MKKDRNNRDNYPIPEKPISYSDQVSMMWDYLYNHLPGKLREQDRRLHWQDVKLNFVLVFLALVLVCFGELLLG